MQFVCSVYIISHSKIAVPTEKSVDWFRFSCITSIVDILLLDSQNTGDKNAFFF